MDLAFADDSDTPLMEVLSPSPYFQVKFNQAASRLLGLHRAGGMAGASGYTGSVLFGTDSHGYTTVQGAELDAPGAMQTHHPDMPPTAIFPNADAILPENLQVGVYELMPGEGDVFRLLPVAG